LSEPLISSIPIQEFWLWEKMKGRRALISFDLEITARCNNNCRHCYINLPAGDGESKKEELSVEGILEIAGEAVSLGAMWCLITGGEPLLRDDFSDIYLDLKRKGLLVSVFTNATLVAEEHVGLFKKYPPRDIEVSVYGVTEETYERVTRRPGSFHAFMRGLNLLLESGVKVRPKAMALRSNVHELPQIARFCREKTKDYFRFDPFLHLRFDRNQTRNEEIRSERLSPEEIVVLERSDPERFQSLEKGCDQLIVPEFSHITCSHLFHCGAGNSSFTVGYDGLFRLCSSLHHPDCVYDLREGSLSDAWHNFVPKVRDMRSDRKEFLGACRVCPLINLCMWCPANAYLETGEMDAPVDYFCRVAHARAEALGYVEKTVQAGSRRARDDR
jgi:radical SAM protein with 4Fe4S-binding SPASM domain